MLEDEATANLARTPDTVGLAGISRLQVLAEYLREGKRKFALCADGHQETSKL